MTAPDPSPFPSVPARAERAATQTLKAQLHLREMIVRGELRPGERLSELQMVELLKVSRTPVRAALMRLEQENLVEALPNGGYAVKRLSEPEILVSIEIRGTLEGLAARMAAERGAPESLRREAGDCLDRLDEVVLPHETGPIDLELYVPLNARFHALIVEMAGSDALARQIERASAMPFASPSALVPLDGASPHTRHVLVLAQDQHRMVLEAISQREGARAESIMREHARNAHRNLRRALAEGGRLAQLAEAAARKG